MQAHEELSQPCEDRDFVEWHQGCPWCAVWVVLLEGEEIAAAVQQARRLLGHVLLERYERQPHITLAYRGLCQGDPAHAAQEYDGKALRADVALLQHLGMGPFTVQIEGVSSFTTVPYLAVGPGRAGLQQLHAALVPQAPAPGWHYEPHVTLGHYARQLPLREVVAMLQTQRLRLPAFEVSRLALVRYASSDIGGPLTVEGVFELGSGRYTASPTALWRSPACA